VPNVDNRNTSPLGDDSCFPSDSVGPLNHVTRTRVNSWVTLHIIVGCHLSFLRRDDFNYQQGMLRTASVFYTSAGFMSRILLTKNRHHPTSAAGLEGNRSQHSYPLIGTDPIFGWCFKNRSFV